MSKPTEYHRVTTSYAVLPKGDPLFSEMATNVRMEDEANARLSAAAPYLLEALEFWLAYKGDDLDAEFHPLCLAAIARAKG